MTEKRPNILIFMPDQLRADSVGAFGNSVVQTPNIDALARRGTLFKNAYVNHPVCGPSRVNLMTGWYPHTRGHRTLDHLVKPWEPNLLQYLKEAGYNVAWAGTRGDTFAPGVTETSTHFCGWIVKPEKRSMGAQYPEGSKLYNAFYHGRRPDWTQPGSHPAARSTWLDFDEAVTRTAEAWLQDVPKEPWVLFMPLIFPHLPFEVEDPWYSQYSPADMPRPVSPHLCQGKPMLHRLIREKYGTDRLNSDDWAEIVRVYYGMISRIDSQLGRVLSGIDQIGATGNTAVFFFSDHGEYLGDYGLVEKWPSGLDNCLLQNPLIVSIPGGREGQVVDGPAGFVETVDLLPTILALADTEVGHTHFGKSFLPLLQDPLLQHRQAAFSEGGFSLQDEHLLETIHEGEYRNKAELQHDQPQSCGKAVSMRTCEYTYVYRLYESDELYQRSSDPAETTNLIDQAEMAAVAREMKDQIMAWLLESSDVIPWQADPRFPRVPNGYHTPFEG